MFETNAHKKMNTHTIISLFPTKEVLYTYYVRAAIVNKDMEALSHTGLLGRLKVSADVASTKGS